MSTDLTFTTQIEVTVESGSQMAGWALQHIRRRGRFIMLTILRSLIQPRLDYCSQLWSLGVHGARLFNLLLAKLRNESSGDFDLFKHHLDIFLQLILRVGLGCCIQHHVGPGSLCPFDILIILSLDHLISSFTKDRVLLFSYLQDVLPDNYC